MKQALLDRIRVFNKYVTNKILIHISGKKFGHFTILGHTGRKSGKLYRIPVIAEPLNGGFVIAMTYGKKVDWYKNVLAEEGCSIHWKNQGYQLTNPKLVDKEVGLTAFPPLLRLALRGAGTEYFLRLDVKG